MSMKRYIGAFLALVMALAAFLPAAALALPEDRSVEIAVTPRAGEGVSIEYDEESFKLSVTPMYGMLRIDEPRTLTLTASFGEGWTYNGTYTDFFSDHPDRVTVTDGADGAKVFTFNAVRGDFVSYDELNAVGIYATAAELPKLEIQASVPFSQINKETYVDATFTLTLGTRQFESGNYEGSGSIKGRGNTSWGQPKKPYSIKLSSKASLLDIPKTKKYAIIPSYSDNSLMRNFMTYKASLMLEGIDYVPKCEFVEVYLNGVYNGIYILVERVSIESNKIDIEEASEDDLTGGYLIEKDIDGKIDFSVDQWFNCPYWANQSRDYFVLKDPEPEDESLLSDMLSYLTSYMQNLHNAVMDDDSDAYTQYVDVDSWVDFIIIQELAKNIDGNLKTSCYMIKKSNDDKLYMTAPWDFDLAFGNPATTWNNADHQHNDYYDCPDATGTSDFMVINSSCPWFDTLYDDHEEFRNALKERWAEYRQTLVPELFALMEESAAYLAAAMPRDEAKWGVRFETGYSQLRNWLEGRVEWLDSQWIGEAEAIDLGLALNVQGGRLEFTNGNYPFRGVVKDGRLAAVSTNAGIDSSDSRISVTVMMERGQTISFDYKISSESNYDKLLFQVNGDTHFDVSGEVDWTTHTYTAVSSGEHTFSWVYRKDYSVAGGADCVWLDNVSWSGQSLLPAGDADANGEVTIDDALMVLRFVLGLTDTLVNDDVDMNADGVVDITDALAVLRIALGLVR